MATVTRGNTPQDLVDANWPASSVSQVIDVPHGTIYPVSTRDGYTPVNQEGKFYLQWAGLQQPATGVQYIVTYEVAPAVLMHGTDFLKAAFTEGLRVAFQNQTMYPAYVYNPDDTRSKLSIHESFPKKPFKNPAIIVSIGTSKLDRNTLTPSDLLKEERDEAGVPIAFYAWGQIPSTINIGIVALTDSDRRKLTDITALFIRHLFTFQFAKFGIGYKSVTIEGEKESEWQGQLLYMNNISIPCYSEWQCRYPIKLVDIISEISIESIEKSL